MTGKKQAAANKKNAQRSTGPKTTAGKRTSSMNAMKHGVFAKELVTDCEDQKLFDQLLDRLISELSPTTQIQFSLVEGIAASMWRQRRLAVAEKKWIEEHILDAKYDRLPHISMGGDHSRVGALPIKKQILIGRYQFMLTNLARALLRDLRNEQNPKAN
ncbi:MAG: hypothetical protein ABJH52_08255 [Henriciella sp.]